MRCCCKYQYTLNLICSLLQGLGRLSTARAGHLARASWRPYLFIWTITLTAIWLLSWAIPSSPPPFVLIPKLTRSEASFLDLIIAANPFEAFNQNNVHAIVLLAILYGLAVEGMPNRQTLFDMLEVGFDVAFMHQLAADLGIKLEFIPFSWQELPQDLSEGRFDIAVSGIYLTHLRLHQSKCEPCVLYWIGCSNSPIGSRQPIHQPREH